MEEIIGSFRYLVYPKGKPISDDTWMVVQYMTEDNQTISATGTNLPITPDVSVRLTGEWKKTEKYGEKFQVTATEIILPTSEKGVVSYMVSLKIGVGKVKAKMIYATFKENVWDILDNNPDALLRVRGITPEIVRKLNSKTQETKVDRELIRAFNGIMELSASKILDLKKAFGKNLLSVIDTEPYRLCEVRGFNFRLVDKLGRRKNIAANAYERLSAALCFVLENFSGSGHVCMPLNLVIERMGQELNCENMTVTVDQIKAGIKEAWQKEVVKATSGFLYLTHKFEQEQGIAKELCRLLSQKSKDIKNLDVFIDEYEKKEGITLADSQKEAVKMVLNHHASIITGGPGTGKSTIIKAVLYIHKRVFGNDSMPLLVSPTGRAARRMTEASGYPAQTVHSAIGYDGTEYRTVADKDKEPINANLIVVDESSMMDLYITSRLLLKVKTEAHIVFVGDPDQLPSVGCGNVLFEMIRSCKVPMTRLNVIFRQGKDSPIITNAAKIRTGDTNLMFGNHFCLFMEYTTEGVFERVVEIYKKSVLKYGLDNVILLNPYREKTIVNVFDLNLRLQNEVNPEVYGELTLSKNAKLSFRVRDKVMQLKNTEGPQNGDVGYITKIEEVMNDDGDLLPTAFVKFVGDAAEYKYDKTNVHELDLAYCCTVHKSQGTESKVVIIALSVHHSAMLRRNVLYTAVTRASETCVIVTECPDTQYVRGMLKRETAIESAILNWQTEVRYTLLGDRIFTLLAGT